MNIIITNKKNAQKLSYSINESCIIISISDIDEKNNKFCKNNKNIKDILYLHFSDVEDFIPNDYTQVPMNLNDAKKIKKFIDFWNNKVSTLIIHCAMGISRSATIGIFLEKILNNKKEEELFSSLYTPKRIIFDLLCEVYNINYSKEEIDILFNINQKFRELHDFSSLNILFK